MTTRQFQAGEEPIRVKIRQLGETIATSGFFLLTGDRAHRKLEPGEVVTVYPHEPAYDVVYQNLGSNSPLLDITGAPATRPLRYAHGRDAAWSSPNANAGKESDQEKVEKALAATPGRIEAEAEEWQTMLTDFEEASKERADRERKERETAEKKAAAARKARDAKAMKAELEGAVEAGEMTAAEAIEKAKAAGHDWTFVDPVTETAATG